MKTLALLAALACGVSSAHADVATATSQNTTVLVKEPFVSINAVTKVTKVTRNEAGTVYIEGTLCVILSNERGREINKSCSPWAADTVPQAVR